MSSNTREKNKKHRTEQIILAAEELFSEKGLYDVQMQDVATKANVGIATLFRYFPKKENLIVEVAVFILSNFQDDLKKIADSEKNAYEKFEELFEYFLEIANGPARKVTLFREAFESYSSYKNEPLENIESYIDIQKELSREIFKIIKQGVEDDSLRSDINMELALQTITNCFSIFSTRITLHEKVAIPSSGITPIDQQQFLKEMFLHYIRA
ncbi:MULTISPECIES: TetR/AcrR family transcriptional regulator [unclassified Peribacillus]|uniref:TetR/AcrR family transcriptional regulator n=1 Tax=unclassified Peribacillus TaxID=2675266 RepID=UPI003813C957